MSQEPAGAPPPHLLEVDSLSAGYGALQVLWGISLSVRQGEFVALVGANGAGKTAVLRAIAGLIPPVSGAIRFRGKPTLTLKTHQLCRRGLALVSETLNLFPLMSVRENLLLGAYGDYDRDQIGARLDFAFDFFPVLKERLRQPAGTLSGGEQRMLGLARAFVAHPLLLLVDEPSRGLSPNLVNQMFAALERLNRRGVAVLLVEQNIQQSLRVAGRGYVLEQGRMVMEGSGSDLLNSEKVRRSYLGLG